MVNIVTFLPSYCLDVGVAEILQMEQLVYGALGIQLG